MTNCNFTASHCPGIKHFSLLLTYVLKSQKMTSSSLILLSWLLLVGCVACYRGYSPLYSRTLRCGVASRHVMRSPRSVLWVAKDNDSEQTITDLNLEEMFDVFEAADKKIKTSDLKPAKLTMNDNPTVDGNAVAAGSDENKGDSV